MLKLVKYKGSNYVAEDPNDRGDKFLLHAKESVTGEPILISVNKSSVILLGTRCAGICRHFTYFWSNGYKTMYICKNERSSKHGTLLAEWCPLCEHVSPRLSIGREVREVKPKKTINVDTLSINAEKTNPKRGPVLT